MFSTKDCIVSFLSGTEKINWKDLIAVKTLFIILCRGLNLLNTPILVVIFANIFGPINHAYISRN